MAILKIEAWQTEDGRMFQSEKEAKKHELWANMRHEYEKCPILAEGKFAVSLEEAIEWITGNHNLAHDMVEFAYQGGLNEFL